MSLTSILPLPKHTSKWDDASDDDEPEIVPKSIVKKGPPPYGSRAGFIPKTAQDYNDGGAYPEIHIAQYPCGLGKATGALTVSGTIPLSTDDQGHIKYDLVLRQGERNPDKIIQSSIKDLKASDVLDEEDASIAKPTLQEIEQVTKKTKDALDAILGKKVSYATSKNDEERKKGPEFVRYTPANNADQITGSNSRIISMMEAPVDPMEPPRFKNKKLPRGPGSPPAPVMHSPPRKLTVQEQKDWVIPPCISSWKNAKGYTIPLDKRLANDGRGLQDITINDNFAKLSEALFIADRHAREEVRLRGEMQSKVAAKEKKEKEEKLRLLAQKAREERAGLVSGTRNMFDTDQESEVGDVLTESERRELQERESVRRDKAKQREREMRMNNMGAETKARVVSSSNERDISEKIALGLAQPTLSKESMFDQRLFNQTAGLSSGFGAEDAYSLYDKPLFVGSSASMIYKPTISREESVPGVSTEKLEKLIGEQAPHKGFQGADVAEVRNGPVQFEKESDPFGVTDFMHSAKRGREVVPEETSKKSRS